MTTFKAIIAIVVQSLLFVLSGHQQNVDSVGISENTLELDSPGRLDEQVAFPKFHVSVVHVCHDGG